MLNIRSWWNRSQVQQYSDWQEWRDLNRFTYLWRNERQCWNGRQEVGGIDAADVLCRVV